MKNILKKLNGKSIVIAVLVFSLLLSIANAIFSIAIYKHARNLNDSTNQALTIATQDRQTLINWAEVLNAKLFNNADKK